MAVVDKVLSILFHPVTVVIISLAVIFIAFITLPQNVTFGMIALVAIVLAGWLWLQLQQKIAEKPVEEWLALARRYEYKAALSMRFLKPLKVRIRRFKYNEKLERCESETPRMLGRCLGAGRTFVDENLCTAEYKDKESDDPALKPLFELSKDYAKTPVYVLAMEAKPGDLYETVYFIPLENIDSACLDESGDFHEGLPIMVFGTVRVMEDGIHAVIDTMKKDQLDLCTAALATTCYGAGLIKSLNKLEMISRLNSTSKPEVRDKHANEEKEAKV